jgi:hypothetical protein
MKQAASRLKDLREDISKILMEIPTILSCANRAQNVFKTSKELRRVGTEVFVATITLLQHILVYYKVKVASKSNTFSHVLCELERVTLVGKTMGALLGQSDYERDLTDSIEMLRFRSLQFEEVAHTSAFQVAEHTRANVQALRTDTHQTSTNLHQHVNLARMESYEQYESLKYHMNCISQVLQTVIEVLVSNSRLDQRTQDLRSPTLPIRRARSTPTLRRLRIEAEQSCLDLLDYEDSMVQSNIQKSLRCAYRLPKPAQDRIIAIIRHHRIRSWLGDVNSSVLFLNGHYNSPRAMAQSPTSFFCARLASAMQPNTGVPQEPSLRPSTRALAISFFCAEHLDSEDSYQGARGIVKSLTAQLLVSYNGFDTRLMKQLLKADLDHLKTLCATLKILIGKLPKEIVLFCIIDTITVHEESESRCKNVEFVLDTLAEIAESDDGRNCVFKLLLTSPRISRRYSGRVGGKTVRVWLRCRRRWLPRERLR